MEFIQENNRNTLYYNYEKNKEYVSFIYSFSSHIFGIILGIIILFINIIIPKKIIIPLLIIFEALFCLYYYSYYSTFGFVQIYINLYFLKQIFFNIIYFSNWESILFLGISEIISNIILNFSLKPIFYYILYNNVFFNFYFTIIIPITIVFLIYMYYVFIFNDNYYNKIKFESKYAYSFYKDKFLIFLNDNFIIFFYCLNDNLLIVFFIIFYIIGVLTSNGYYNNKFLIIMVIVELISILTAIVQFVSFYSLSISIILFSFLSFFYGIISNFFYEYTKRAAENDNILIKYFRI